MVLLFFPLTTRLVTLSPSPHPPLPSFTAHSPQQGETTPSARHLPPSLDVLAPYREGLARRSSPLTHCPEGGDSVCNKDTQTTLKLHQK